MNEESHRQEEKLFEAALTRPAAERAAFLAEACAGDETLQRRVGELLRFHDDGLDFLAPAPLHDLAAAVRREQDAAQPAEAPGMRIGRYTLREKIGEGGCGVVYLAEQEEPVRRKVALKIIKLGMDTREVIARFEVEQQALALMDHPGIARVFDAGATAGGRPFFAMELVEGVAITKYCDQARLAPAARLELFIDVCRAIQHAHFKGVIHRDIKPSNILVTRRDGAPAPKVIDFGVAKAVEARLTDKTLFTAFGHFIGTPAYMSPEQTGFSARGVDTRSDIYSLGVLLYELLTGRTPFESKDLIDGGIDEMRRRIREEEPSRPSTRLTTLEGSALEAIASARQVEPPQLIQSLRGELDWVVMRCLEKDPARRYETADALAEDLRRFLRHEPVSAVAPSGGYVLRKLFRRHRLAFAAGGAVAAALLAGAAVSTRLFLRERAAREQAQAARAHAEAQEKQAQAEATRSTEVARFMQDMLKGIGPAAAQGRDTRLLLEIVEATAPRIDALANQPAVQADLWATLGDVYHQLGEITKAMDYQRRALAQRRRIHAGDHAKVVDSLIGLGMALRGQSQRVEATVVLREALAMQTRLDPAPTERLVKIHQELGSALSQRGTDADSEVVYRRGLEIAQRLPGDNRRLLAAANYGVGSIVRLQERYAESEPFFRASLALLGQLEPTADIELQRIGTLHNLAYTLQMLSVSRPEKRADVEPLTREALALQRKLLGPDHPRVHDTLHKFALFLRDNGRMDEAKAAFDESLRIRRLLLAREPNNPTLARHVVGSLANIYEIPIGQNRYAEAEAYAREGLEIARRVFPNDGPELAGALRRMGRILALRDRPAEAEEAYREAFVRGLAILEPRIETVIVGLDRILRPAGRTAEADVLWRQLIDRGAQLDAAQDAGVFVVHTVGALIRANRFAQAEVLAREQLARWEAKAPADWHAFAFRTLLGMALVRQEKYAAAEPLLRSGVPGLRERVEQIPSVAHLELRQPFRHLADLYRRWGKPEQAAEWQRKHAETQAVASTVDMPRDR